MKMRVSNCRPSSINKNCFQNISCTETNLNLNVGTKKKKKMICCDEKKRKKKLINMHLLLPNSFVMSYHFQKQFLFSRDIIFFFFYKQGIHPCLQVTLTPEIIVRKLPLLFLFLNVYLPSRMYVYILNDRMCQYSYYNSHTHTHTHI